jgi:hypothetical protein
MKLNKNILFVVSLGVILGAGCGSSSGGGDKKQNVVDINKTQEINKTKEIVSDINATIEDNATLENNSTKDIISVGYTTEEGILIETKADGTKRAWVNTRSEDCLIYRPFQQGGGNVYDGGKQHCENLNAKKYANITSWRMPEEDEAVYTMANVTAEDGILYPDDNPNCYYMATNTKHRYVYSTAYTSKYSDHSGAFTDEGKTIAGIRCVADQ